MKTIRILIADDHKLMRMGLTTLFAGVKNFECVGEADTGKAAVALARKLRPDIVIMDLMMPEMSGAEATKIIRAELPDTRVIALTSYGTSKEMADAINNGASGALLKDVAINELTKVIRAVASGQTVIPMQFQTLSREQSESIQLTEHQLQILSSVAIGRSNADIAKEFGIAENTVKNTIRTILTKTGSANRAEAANYARSRHLISV